MSNENYKVMYDHAINSNIKLVDENKFLKLNNEKLNNIINEFEKWLKAHLDDGFYWFKMYDKLQELKGSDKE